MKNLKTYFQRLSKKNNNHNDIKEESNTYPSAKLLVEASYQDYIRLLDAYNKIYDKLNILIAFIGVIFGIFISSIDFTVYQRGYSQLKAWQIILLVIPYILPLVCLIIFLYCIFKSLNLLRGKRLTVFRSEDLRKDDLCKESEENVALWLVDKYTQCSSNLRPMIEKNQKEFEHILSWTMVGLFILIVSIFIQKVGL